MSAAVKIDFILLDAALTDFNKIDNRGKCFLFF